MGNMFTITVVSENPDFAEENIQIAITEIQRIEALFTTYNKESQTNLIKTTITTT